MFLSLIFKLADFNVLHILLKEEGVLLNSPSLVVQCLLFCPLPCFPGPARLPETHLPCPWAKGISTLAASVLMANTSHTTPPVLLQVESLSGMEWGRLRELRKSGEKSGERGESRRREREKKVQGRRSADNRTTQ